MAHVLMVKLVSYISQVAKGLHILLEIASRIDDITRMGATVRLVLNLFP